MQTRTLIIFAVAVCLSYCQYDISRMRIVDKNENHFLVRGNLPIVDNKFQFQTLYKQLSLMTGLKGYRLVIYSLLNLLTAKQTKSRYIEQNHFNQDGQYRYEGNIHYYKNHDILGTYFSPAQYPQFLRKYAIKFYKYITYDKIPQLMQNIEKNMKSPFPTVVYVHCSQGVDRAGYVAGAYKMKVLGASLSDVIRENLQIMKSVRKYIHFNSFNGMQWYCLFLKRSQEECLVGVEGASKGLGLQATKKQTQQIGQRVKKVQKIEKTEKLQKQQKKKNDNKKQL